MVPWPAVDLDQRDNLNFRVEIYCHTTTTPCDIAILQSCTVTCSPLRQTMQLHRRFLLCRTSYLQPGGVCALLFFLQQRCTPVERSLFLGSVMEKVQCIIRRGTAQVGREYRIVDTVVWRVATVWLIQYRTVTWRELRHGDGTRLNHVLLAKPRVSSSREAREATAIWLMRSR